jgi:hypothetical protein
MAITTRLIAQKKMDGGVGVMLVYCGTMAEGDDVGDGDKAGEQERRCLAASWCRGYATGGERGQGEDEVGGATSRTGVSSGMSTHALARRGCHGHVLARALHASRWPSACTSGFRRERGRAQGHGEVSWSVVEKRMAWWVA